MSSSRMMKYSYFPINDSLKFKKKTSHLEAHCLFGQIRTAAYTISALFRNRERKTMKNLKKAGKTEEKGNITSISPNILKKTSSSKQ